MSDVSYRGWHVRHDPPPIPVRNCDWQFWHDDFDGAPDANDNRSGSAASLEAAKSEIDAWELENGENAGLRERAEAVWTADLVRADDRSGRLGGSDFADLGKAVVQWLDAGMLAEGASELLGLAEAVHGRDYGQVWSDPGVYPSNAGASALPDRWEADHRPNQLAAEIIDLLSDMGLPGPALSAA